MQSNSFFIVTGGPGSGKTSVTQALIQRGIHVMPEAGRAIIQDQRAIGGSALPWADRHAFAEQMLGWDLRSYREAQDLKGSVLFDRGIPDVIGFLSLCRLPIPDHLRRAADLYRYGRHVFLAPHWPAIYRQDAERRQSAEEAAATCEAISQAYSAQGYDLVPLPLAPIEQRVAFILDRIAAG